MNGLDVRPTPTNGLGLFAANQDYAAGEVIVPLGGPIVPEDQRPNFQVGPAEFMGPSGTAADAINHSCSPSAWVEVVPGYPVRALRPIAHGEEVTIDYSLTHTTENRVFFRCLCGAINCRGHIGGFVTIPRWQQERYLKLKLVPGYVRDKYLASLLGL